MKVTVAKTAGFCMGVRRAVDLAVDQSTSSSKIFTIGPLIHNTQTVEMLKGRGVEILDEDQLPPAGATILIRAHGIPPEMQAYYEQQGYRIIDGTCPKVKTVHKVIHKHRTEGFNIVLVGDEGHAEVLGLMGYAGESARLVQTPGDVDKLPEFEKVCLVSQTTFDGMTFDEITERMKEKYRGSTLKVKKTVCSATDRRQKETRELASKMDAMIVVGGRHSANTLRLAKISGRFAPHFQHVATESEIDWEPLKDCRTVGITAGASTPNWMINRVAEHVRFLARTKKISLPNIIWQFFGVLANLNVFVAFAAVAAYYASCYLQGFPFTATGASLAFLYLMSMYLWNSLTSIEMIQHLGISRYLFYEAHSRKLMLLAVMCICLLLVISYINSGTLFCLMLIPTFAGCLYHFSIVPAPLRRFFRYTNLKDIPTSRELFVAIAWAVLITFIPHAIQQTFVPTPGMVLFFLWVFFLAYLRSLIFDLKDIEGDRIMGRETLVTIIGEKRVRKTIYASLGLLTTVIICFSLVYVFPKYPWPGPHTVAFLFQIPVIFYLWLFMKWNHAITSDYATLFNIFADGQFFLVGLGAWIAHLVYPS